MAYFNYLMLAILLGPVVAFGQRHDSTGSRYSNLKYEIVNVDTVVTHYIDGEYNTPSFKKWDSTKIWADIILIGLPKEVDSISLKNKVEGIMKEKGINKAGVFRDKHSTVLYRLSSLAAHKLLTQSGGFLGRFEM